MPGRVIIVKVGPDTEGLLVKSEKNRNKDGAHHGGRMTHAQSSTAAGG